MWFVFMTQVDEVLINLGFLLRETIWHFELVLIWHFVLVLKFESEAQFHFNLRILLF